MPNFNSHSYLRLIADPARLRHGEPALMDSPTSRNRARVALPLLVGLLATCLRSAEEPPAADAAAHDHAVRLDAFQVVTTGTRTQRLFSEVPIKTEMLGADDFTAAMAFELGSALELLNGARTEANCQNCGTAEIQLLGLPGNYNQILIDGRPQFTGVAAVYGIDQVPTIFVNRIEVVKGGGSSLYGPGAVAGVINLIPEEPHAPHTHLDFTLRSIRGAHTRQSQFASHAVSHEGALKTTVYGLTARQDGHDANADGFTELVQRDNNTLGTYLWWTPSEHTRLRFNYQYIHEERRGGDRLEVPEEFARIAESLTTDYHWATLAWDHDWSPDLRFSASTSLVKFHRDSFYGGTGEELIQPDDPAVDSLARTYRGSAPDASAPPGSDAARAAALFGDPSNGSGGGSFNSFGATATTSWYFDASIEWDAGELGSTGSHHLIVGVQSESEALRDEQLNAAGGFITFLHRDTYRNVGVFVQDEWRINDRLELVAGLRADKTNTLAHAVISPRVAARWITSPTLTWRANFSSGFLSPRVFDEDIHIENIGGVARDIVNPADLREERSRTFAFGADFTPASWDGRLVTAVQTYFTRLENAFDLDEGSVRVENGREKIDRVNSEGSTVVGIEWDASYQLNTWLSFNAGLAYSRARYEIADPDRGTTRYNKMPDWSGQLQVVYSNAAFVDGFLACKWTGGMLADRLDSVVPGANPVESTPDFVVIDVGLSKTFSFEHVELTARIGVNNLLDQRQHDMETGASRDPGYIYGPRYPRTWSLGARVDF